MLIKVSSQRLPNVLMDGMSHGYYWAAARLDLHIPSKIELCVYAPRVVALLTEQLYPDSIRIPARDDPRALLLVAACRSLGDVYAPYSNWVVSIYGYAPSLMRQPRTLAGWFDRAAEGRIDYESAELQLANMPSSTEYLCRHLRKIESSQP